MDIKQLLQNEIRFSDDAIAMMENYMDAFKQLGQDTCVSMAQERITCEREFIDRIQKILDKLDGGVCSSPPSVYSDFGEYFYHCPECGKPLERMDGYCRHCGKELDWSHFKEYIAKVCQEDELDEA